MKIFATLYDNRYNKLYDISEAILDLTISTKIEDDPGKATFKLIKRDDIAFWEGATVSITVDNINMFKGFVFKKKRGKDVDIIDVICYNQLRYLKNKDYAIFENMTIYEIFSNLCERFAPRVKYRVVDKSSHKCTPRNNVACAIYEMIQEALRDTLINSGKWFIIRDNFGVLEHVDIMSRRSGLILGDGSGVEDLLYETSIDKDTYNQIKLYRENKDTSKREIFIVNDTVNSGDTLNYWGVLQLYEKVDEDLNLAQIEHRAMGMLKLYNNTKRSLRLQCRGFPSIEAGSIIQCSIKDLGDLSMNSDLLITSCTHNIANEDHTMTLDMEVVTNV